MTDGPQAEFPSFRLLNRVVETVRHTLDAAGGFRSDLEAVEQQPPAHGGGAGGGTVTTTTLREGGVDWSGLSAAERAERAGA
ncbi:hypothetical protein [Roseospira visakhapatnamensis]|uniref:Uncharacterized protein n=1 Tax=Roseospira visakhapatnamensis TaxID=390880 RepID=A0A7W6RGF5_9PROT|nr:hypothetical protein [Roseospira visakhapatnamensis]MBB4268120.1 hypothetical protein [Roseospira visakhapatnamensis]